MAGVYSATGAYTTIHTNLLRNAVNWAMGAAV